MATDAITLYKHPEYEANRAGWQVIKDLYDGDHATLVKPEYLWLHRLETQPTPIDPGQPFARDPERELLRSIRCQRTRYLNLNEVAISIWASIFFKKEYKLDPSVKSLLGDAEYDIDGKGNSLMMFMKNIILEHMLNYGRAFVLVDKAPYISLSKGQEIERGDRAYFEALHPLSVVDWSIESQDPKRAGNLNMLRYEYQLLSPRLRATEEPIVSRYSDEYYLDGTVGLTRYELKESRDATEERWNIVGEQPLLNKEIPISYISDVSWMKDASQEALRFHNLRSDYDSILHNQAYQRIFAIGVNTANSEEIKALAEYVINCISSPQGSVVAIEPPEMSGLKEALNASLDSFFKQALNMTRQLASDSKESQSSESQAQEKQNVYALVESTLDDLETLINSALKHYAFFTKGIGDFDGKIELDKEISEENWDEVIRTVNVFRQEIEKQPVVHRAVVAKVIQRLKLGDEVTKQALEDLKTANLAPEPLADQVKQERTGLLNGIING